MIGRTIPRFRAAYAALPSEVKTLARKAYRQWRLDPYHNSLNFERLKGNLWSVRIGAHYRALGKKSDATEDGQAIVVWSWIGTHEEYNRLIK